MIDENRRDHGATGQSVAPNVFAPEPFLLLLRRWLYSTRFTHKFHVTVTSVMCERTQFRGFGSWAAENLWYAAQSDSSQGLPGVRGPALAPHVRRL
jgi:hypothetical protein